MVSRSASVSRDWSMPSSSSLSRSLTNADRTAWMSASKSRWLMLVLPDARRLPSIQHTQPRPAPPVHRAPVGRPGPAETVRLLLEEVDPALGHRIVRFDSLPSGVEGRLAELDTELLGIPDQRVRHRREGVSVAAPTWHEVA